MHSVETHVRESLADVAGRREGTLGSLSIGQSHGVDEVGASSRRLSSASNLFAHHTISPAASTRLNGGVLNTTSASTVVGVVRNQHIGSIDNRKSRLVGALHLTKRGALFLSDGFLLNHIVRGCGSGSVVDGNIDSGARSDGLEKTIDLNVTSSTRSVERETTIEVVDVLTKNTVLRALRVAADVPLGGDGGGDIRWAHHFEVGVTPLVASTTLEGSSAVEG